MANLSPQQQKFVDALFSDDTQGDVELAMKIAGYSGTPQSKALLCRAMANEIMEATTYWLSMRAPKAARGVVDAMENYATPGIQHKLKAATEILDRTGLAKRDTLEIKSEGPAPIILLPAKGASNGTENSED